PLELPADDPGHVYHLFVVQVDERDGVLAALRAGGIGAAVHYPTPVHLQPAYAGLGYGEGALPVTETLAREMLSLPIYPEMPDIDVARVIDAVNTIVADSREAA
ncbi:MAG TPA: DegT/DnrJ/EryC1/StrS family aminotransferase, partial [Amaricoccus sp.]|nr:DegT/DnrJ/EryC1/StrS family aminotransferase [Amaricoccus sp.]